MYAPSQQILSRQKVGIMLAKKTNSSLVPLMYPTYLSYNFVASSSEDQLEDVVEDVVAASTVGKELECLAVVHGSLFIVDLENDKVSKLFRSTD